MQAPLIDRFQHQVHREMREMPVYVLVAGKNGPKFKASDPEADPTQHYSLKGRNNFITMPKAGMSDIVDAVSNAFLDRPVVDKTGLTGTYDIQLTYTPNAPINRETETELGDVNVFQAVEQQLGLELDARKEIVEMLVVDRAEKPSGN
jgi:uncharacterized protein (TIGR03435 family)